MARAATYRLFLPSWYVPELWVQQHHPHHPYHQLVHKVVE